MSRGPITIGVVGRPAQKGSKVARFNKKTGRAWVVDANQDAAKSWHVAVQQAAQLVMVRDKAQPFVGVPLAVVVTFKLQRPAGHYGKSGLKPSAPVWPHKSPDLDKYVRCTMDGLEGIVFENDARIVQCSSCKVYAHLGEPEGATITIRSL